MLFAALAAAGFAPAGTASPSSGLPSSAQEEQLIARFCQTSKYSPTLTGTWQPGPPDFTICGSDKPDRFKVAATSKSASGQPAVTATFGGDDTVDTSNGSVDYVDGGTGHNTVVADRCDTVVHAKVRYVGPKACPGTKPSRSLHARSAVDWLSLVTQPYIVCTTQTGTGKHLIQIEPDPMIRAVDSTPRVDWQVVAWQPVLYWRADETHPWTIVSRNRPLWDFTYDEQVSAFPGNFWRRFDTGQRWFEWFTPSAPGEYMVAVDYAWYRPNGTRQMEFSSGSQVSGTTVPDLFHLGPFASPDESACEFPSGPAPVQGTYTGTTDEQQSVSMQVVPEFASSTPAGAWSRIARFTFASSVSCTSGATTTTQTWTITRTQLTIAGDDTFSYSFSQPLPVSSGEQNVMATYFFNGTFDPATSSASGTVRIARISYDANGAHFDCTGVPHVWSATLGG